MRDGDIPDGGLPDRDMTDGDMPGRDISGRDKPDGDDPEGGRDREDGAPGDGGAARGNGRTDGNAGKHDRSRAARWGLAGCTAAVAALLAGLPWAAHDRLPDRLATHWSGGSVPDDSMPLWAASLFPAGFWLLVVLAVSIRWHPSWPAVRPWRAMTLAPAGAALVGAQASIVRANLDRAD